MPEMSHDATVGELPLLAQAEHRRAAARATEHRLRREVERAGSGGTWDEVSAAQQESRRAQQHVDQLLHARDSLRATRPQAVAAGRRAEGAVAQAEQTARQLISRARHDLPAGGAGPCPAQGQPGADCRTGGVGRGRAPPAGTAAPWLHEATPD